MSAKMSLFKSRKKFTVSERDPVYKVRYLGNVQTSMMRGEGCVDKPTAVLWNNYVKTASGGLDMKLTISASGLKAVTKEQGLTEYRAHRISYCIAHPKYPKLFVWVYRHEGKKLKVELRCHAVICKTEAKAKAMAVQLHDKLACALSEFMREKCRRQNTRLALQRTNSLPVSGHTGFTGGTNARNKFLSTGQNFKPPVDRSASAPKLGSINEDLEPEGDDLQEEEDEDEDDLDDDYMLVMSAARRRKKSGETEDLLPHPSGLSRSASGSPADQGDLLPTSRGGHQGEVVAENMFSLEVGNDVEELKKDSSVRYQLDHADSEDDDSSESGFSEQDLRESSSYGSDPQLASNGHSNGSPSNGSPSNGSHSNGSPSNGSPHCPLHSTSTGLPGGAGGGRNGHGVCQCEGQGEDGLKVTLSPSIPAVATAGRLEGQPDPPHPPHHSTTHHPYPGGPPSAAGNPPKHTTSGPSVPNGRPLVAGVTPTSGTTYKPQIINERRL